MAAERTITSANSVVTLSVPGLFPAPRQLQGYSADRAWATETLTLAEVQKGIDGRMTGGYVQNPVKQTFTLQADSPSKDIFNAIARQMQATQEIFYISGTIDVPSTGESFVCTRGILTDFKSLPDAAKVLEPMEFAITWESLKPTLNG